MRARRSWRGQVAGLRALAVPGAVPSCLQSPPARLAVCRYHQQPVDSQRTTAEQQPLPFRWIHLPSLEPPSQHLRALLFEAARQLSPATSPPHPSRSTHLRVSRSMKHADSDIQTPNARDLCGASRVPELLRKVEEMQMAHERPQGDREDEADDGRGRPDDSLGSSDSGKLFFTQRRGQHAAVMGRVSFTEPTFVGARLSDEWLSRNARILAAAFRRHHAPRSGSPEGESLPPLVRVNTVVSSEDPPFEPRRVVVDFASPNLCKDMHVGHLRSMLLGESISRTLELAGHEVDRISHVGDFGTPMGFTIAQLANEGRLDGLTGEGGATRQPGTPDIDLADVSKAYAAARSRANAEKRRNASGGTITEAARPIAAHIQRSLAKAKSRQSGSVDDTHDPIMAAWSLVCQVSRAAFEAEAGRMGIRVREVGESAYAADLADVVRELEFRELCEDSLGAKVVTDDTVLRALGRAPDKNGKAAEKLDLSADAVGEAGATGAFLIQKKDGSHLYSTTDLATLRHRVATDNDWLIYVVDQSQYHHFQRVFRIGEAAGWLLREGYSPDDAPQVDPHTGANIPTVRLDHVAFGVILGDDGRKLSSRSGTAMSLSQLLDVGEEATRAALREHQKNSVFANHVQDGTPEFDTLVRKTADNALKFYDLRTQKKYRMSLDAMLSLKGSAMSIMYSFARVNQILREAEARGLVDVDSGSADPERQRWGATAVGPVWDSEPRDNPARALAVELALYADAVVGVEQHLSPHFLVEYSTRLAAAFNRFYEECPVLTADTEELRTGRLQLCAATATVLQTAAYILGLRLSDRL